MNTEIHESVQDEKGFTLVELAIVMVIIGLLIGGILKGQEMIANAQVTSTVAQVKGITAANSTFRDMYDAMPGDIANATTRLPSCANQCANDGDGDGVLDEEIGTSASEGLNFWAHLSAADLLSGVDNSGSLVWGEGVPSANAGGGFSVGFHVDGDVGGVAAGRGGHYVAIHGTPDDVDIPALSASAAARMDRKMDDGQSDSGSVIAIENVGDCETGGVYDEATDEIACSLAIRL